MSLINPAILYGLALGLIPVILHFLLRPRPKKLLFPALRLIQMRRKENQRRMRLRHIWLLLLRIAVIMLLVLAIARPALPPANYGLNGREGFSLLAVFVLAALVYAGVLYYWKRQRLPNHSLTYRRSLLRGGTGAASLLLFLLLVVWPYQRRIAAEISAPLPDVANNLPAAAIFLFDSSVSMKYRLESKTRLDLAQKIATEHLGRLPSGSRVAVADSSTDQPIHFLADLAVAQATIDSLKSHPVSFPLDDRLRTALRMQEADYERTLDGQRAVAEKLRSDRYLREIYLFTDMARSSWQTRTSKLLKDELARLSWIQVYVIDVGVEKPTNMGISSFSLSQQSLTAGRELTVRLVVQSTGMAEQERLVELHVRNVSGQLVKRERRPVTVGPDKAAQVTLTAHGLMGPFARGELRLVSSDPLSDDDVRHFTVAVRPASRILLVGDASTHVTHDADYMYEALSVAGYRVTYVSTKRVGKELDRLNRYEAVCLVHVRHPTAQMWDALSQYVDEGGGLAVFLGMPNVPNGSEEPAAVAYNHSAVAKSFLPAKLLADLKFDPPEQLDLRNRQHPILAKFDEYGGFGELASVDVKRYWRVEPYEGASVISSYTNGDGSPALLERIYGQGRTVMLTTAVDLKGDKSWNQIARYWPFMTLTDQIMQHVGRFSKQTFNYLAGDDVLIHFDRSQPLKRYLLRKPQLEQLPGEVDSEAQVLTLPPLDSSGRRVVDQVGSYELMNAADEPTFNTEFSVNVPPGESDFSRLDEVDLNEILGEDRYSISRDVEGLERRVTAGRLGQEVFSLIMLCMVLVFCFEHLVANRFYEAEQSLTYQ